MDDRNPSTPLSSSDLGNLQAGTFAIPEIPTIDKIDESKLGHVDSSEIRRALVATSSGPATAPGEMNRLLQGLSDRDPKVVEEVRQRLSQSNGTQPPAV